MKRAAIYARFSSDKQNERSCQDQIDLCTAWAERQGLKIVASYADQAISGASTVNRLELGRMMRAARNREFDVVISEALDRLSRDQADLAKVKKDLAFVDVGIQTVQDGEVGAMHIGLKGLMGEMYLADLAQKTRRGLRARVNAGASGGGKSYGYETVQGKPGELIINEREAAIVRRIFDEYVAGRTPRQIVAQLNREGIPGPRGGRWNASTINGSRIRQNGIIQNPLYSGETVWNRQRFIKDPDTGRRVSRPNPPEDWIRKEAPHLQIVETETFVAAVAGKARKSGVRPEFAKRPRHLLSGLCKCADCGSGFIITARDRLACSSRRERGDCLNSSTIGRLEVETRVLEALEKNLGDPEMIAEFVREFQAERRRLIREAGANRATVESRLKEIRDQLERIIDRVVAGNAPEAMVTRMDALEVERKQLEATLKAQPTDEPIQLHPGTAEKYRRITAGLKVHLEQRNNPELMEEVRSLITRIDIGRRNDSGRVPVTVYGPLAEILLVSTSRSPMVGNVGCGDPLQSFPTMRLWA
jgi:site-specific DNA recombinase